ncbi:hypothetical protein A6S26_22285 [Nostoc sp. ATCC 43529]|nr:hypothetical protein A6S26_22285 [Nostoc sp. ATCC 43529]
MKIQNQTSLNLVKIQNSYHFTKLKAPQSDALNFVLIVDYQFFNPIQRSPKILGLLTVSFTIETNQN